MHRYFKLFQDSTRDVLEGNVELAAQDRLLGTLLSFPPQAESVPLEGSPRTGYEPTAVVYIEAEKPLCQLVKQRRRWMNGSVATNVWILREGVISNSSQDQLNKFLSWCMVLLNVIHEMVVRMFGPALLIVWMFRLGLFLPDLFTNPKVVFDPDLSLKAMEINANRLPFGILVGGFYVSSRL